MFSVEEEWDFPGIEINDAEAEVLLPQLNAVSVSQEMLRLAVLYSAIENDIYSDVERYFIRDGEERWNQLSDTQQRASAWRTNCATQLHDRLEHEKIPITLEELRILTLQLPFRLMPTKSTVGENFVIFDLDEALQALQRLRSEANET